MKSMIAIGILVLLALSLMMSSRRFRVASSSLGILAILALVAVGLFGTSGEPLIEFSSPLQTGQADGSGTWRLRFRKPKSIREMAELVSDKILNDISGNKATGLPQQVESSAAGADVDQPQSPHPSDILDERSAADQPPIPPVEFKLAVSPQQKQQLTRDVASNVEQYLGNFQKHNKSPGVDLLKPADLNLNFPGFIKWYPVKSQDSTPRFVQVFDDDAHRYVRLRGRQLQTKQRLISTTYGFMGTIGAMTLLFGLLKFKHARQTETPSNDHLLNSGISIV